MHNNSENGETPSLAQLKHSLIAERSFCDLYLFEGAKERFVVKVFPPGSPHLHQSEISLLSTLSHPNILRPIAIPPSLTAILSAKLNREFIVFPQVKYGNLLNYVARSHRGLSERVTVFYLKQISQALSEVKKTVGVSHPNLVLDNVLMEESRNLLLCGWSNGLRVKRDEPTFELAKLGIQLLVGRDPFLGNFSNFLKAQHIHKFWQQTERSSRTFDKSFSFSEHFKSVLEPMLLKKVTDLSEVQQLFSKLSEYTLSEVQKELQEREKSISEGIAKKHQKIKELHKEEQKVAQWAKQEREDLSLERQPSRNNQAFIEELINQLQNQNIIPSKQSSDNRSYFQLFDNNQNVVVAHLKTHLSSVFEREKTEEREVLVDPLLLLQKDFGVHMEGGELIVHCAFGWNYKEMETETEAQSGVELITKLRLVREGGKLWGAIQAVEGAEAEEICSKRMSLWLEETLQLYS